MYSTCVFCHSSLGQNEAIENFPVGRRLAFDAGKGRLWAVCRKCGRWNLTPIEERWEAIEECERLFRSTIIRASTDEIGLAKIREGTDLIRIGKPLRPEFAAWRYTRHFNRRRMMSYVGIGATIGVAGTSLLFGGPVFTMMPAVAALLGKSLQTTRELKRAQNVITEHAGRGFGKKIRRHERVDVRIIRSPDAQGWALRFVLDGKFLDNYGWEAQHLAHLVAPAINFQGAASRHVDAAVREIERSGSPQLYFMELVKYRERNDLKYTGLYGYPHEMRIAFEMASHEETERAAIEGDLTQLEADWRYAEEIASIADNLLLPRAVTDLMERFKAAKKA